MPNSQSHLFSLATLLESAEQRQSSLPPPPATMAPPEDDSGLIDILAMQARAREASVRPSSKTPLPVVATLSYDGGHAARRAHTDPDLAAAHTATAKRKQKHALLGGVAAGMALVLFAIGFASSTPSPAAAPPRMAAAIQAPAPVAPAPPPPLALPPPPAATPPATPEPVAAAEPASPAKTKKVKKKKSSHAASHPSHGGPSLMKIISGGTAP